MASFDAAQASASLGNGVVTFEYRDSRWSLSFAGATGGERKLLSGCRLDAWLDAERRGRLMGMKPETVKALGLLPLSEARLLGGEVQAFRDAQTNRAALEVAFLRDYRLSAKAAQATPEHPLVITASSSRSPARSSRTPT